MSSSKEVLIELLKQGSCRVTKTRLTIFEQLYNQEPLSMHDLVQQSKGVDRASVYRTVELFERLGIAQRLHLGWKYKIELTDRFAAHHHHLTCLACGKTIPINERDLDELAAQHNFMPTAHQIELQGYCAACQVANSRASRTRATDSSGR
jgi:Fur family transcriptional regulator, ferric uptake regulator